MGKRRLDSANAFFDGANAEQMEEFELSDLLVDIASSFILYRVENNLTQMQLAEGLGVTQAMVSKLESGDYNPSVAQLFKLAKKIGWDLKISLGKETKELQPI